MAKGKRGATPSSRARGSGPRTKTAIKKKTLSQLGVIETKVSDMENAWDGLIDGLGSRAKDRYEIALRKLKSLRTSLRDNAIVDMKNVGKVLRQLNHKVSKGTEDGGGPRLKDMYAIDSLFKETYKSLDDLLDLDAVAGLKELQSRLNKLMRSRRRSIKEIDARFKKMLDSISVSVKKIKTIVPKADGVHLEKLSAATRQAFEVVSRFSISKIQTKKKDLSELAHMIKALEKKLTKILKRFGPKAKDPKPEHGSRSTSKNRRGRNP